MEQIAKACAISDARISFVSLVSKAANKHKFVIAKSDNPDNTQFTCYGRILKADASNHYVTGIVYEPMAADTDGNYMTEEEITKAAHLFVKNNGDIDLQHTFQKAEGATMVESYVTKSDCEIEGQSIKKGTWMMTVEVTDEDVWDSIEKGDITGFSMGGVGKYSTVDDDISKSDDSNSDSGKQGVISKLAGLFGFGSIRKGEVLEEYNRRIKSQRFWTAFDVLQTRLGRYSDLHGKYVFEDDEDVIRQSLEDFSDILIDILTQDDVKSVIEYGNPKIEKSEKEEEDVTKAEVQSMIDDAIAKSVNPQGEKTPEENPVKKEAGITEDVIKKMVQDAIQDNIKNIKKSDDNGDGEGNDANAPVSTEAVQDMIAKAVQEAMAPVLKNAGIPTNLDNEEKPVEKAEQHYMEGVF